MSIFSKASLFSGLIKLQDISLNPRYAKICGFTDSVVDAVFGPEFGRPDREDNRI